MNGILQHPEMCGVFVCGCDCMGGFSYTTRFSRTQHTVFFYFLNVTKPDLQPVF